jgi:hypothetical protein
MSAVLRSHGQASLAAFGAAALLLLLAACDRPYAPASATSALESSGLHDGMFLKFADNPEKQERIGRFGVSFVAPQGENWIEGPRLPKPNAENYGVQAVARFSKILAQVDDGPHTVIAEVSISYIPPFMRDAVAADRAGFIRFLMNQTVKTTKAATGRIRPISVEAVLDDSLATCFRLDVLQEDRGVYGFANVAFPLDLHGFQCVDPSSRFVALISYSQRRPPNVKPTDLTREGEDFLKSLKFSPSEG